MGLVLSRELAKAHNSGEEKYEGGYCVTSVLWSRCFPAQDKYLKVALNWDNQWDMGKDFLGELFLQTGGKIGTTEVGLGLCCGNNRSHLKKSIIGQIYQM